MQLTFPCDRVSSRPKRVLTTNNWRKEERLLQRNYIQPVRRAVDNASSTSRLHPANCHVHAQMLFLQVNETNTRKITYLWD